MIDERLAEMLAPGGCPICHFRTDAEQRILEPLLGESVNDRTFRARLARGRGFCRWHVRQVVAADRRATGGILGAAILFGAVMRQRRAELGGIESAGRRDVAKAAAEALRPADCPVCEQLAPLVEGAASRLLGLTADVPWAEAVGAAEFCLEDLAWMSSRAAAAEGSFRSWTAVARAQQARLAALQARVDGYVDHSSYDRATELTTDEQASIEEAARFLGGDRGSR